VCRWPFGDVTCRLMHYLINVTAYVTVYTLVLVSVIRYMTIVHAARTARYRTANRVVVMIVAIWILTFPPHQLLLQLLLQLFLQL